jgi:hypothetical protein
VVRTSALPIPRGLQMRWTRGRGTQIISICTVRSGTANERDSRAEGVRAPDIAARLRDVAGLLIWSFSYFGRVGGFPGGMVSQ